jgi:CubicO group peptidase (beta-lactamase class C family)
VEELTGKRLDAYLREVFWEPMGLKHITYNPLENGFTEDDCAATELMGNSRDGQLHYSGIRTDVIQGEVHDPNAYYCMDGVSGHAGLFASASDLARLASVMLSGGYGPNRWFSQDAIDLFTAPNSSDVSYYGLGWWREGDHMRDRYFGSVTSSDTYGHQGFTGTLTMIDPEENLVVVLLTNSIHSRLLENDATLTEYKGGFYTTSVLGFVPQILSVGADSDSGVLRSILYDMTQDAERQLQEDGISEESHPKYQAYLALTDALRKWDGRTAEEKTEKGAVK